MLERHLLISLFLYILVGCALVRGVDKTPLQVQRTHTITEDFSEYAQKVLDENNIKGLSLAIVEANGAAAGNVEFGSWGVMTEYGDAVDSKTLFSIGSCTKAFLATSLGILMDDFATGKNVTPLPEGVTDFNWQSKLVDLLPGEWELKDKWANEKADVRDILSHVSGLAGQDYAYGPGDTARDLVVRLRHLDTALELRQQSSYNNAMYITGAHLLSVYANRTFHEFARERIFRPLGMNATTMSPTEAERSGHLSHAWSSPLLNSSGHTVRGRRIPFWFSEETAQFVSGAGGIISNVEDMAKWVDIQLHKGVIPSTNETVIPRSVFDAVTMSSVIVHGSGSTRNSIMGYGMGWRRYSSNGHEFVSHTGGIPGFLSLVAFFPHDGLGIIALTNTDQGYKVNNALVRRITSDYFDNHIEELSSDYTQPFSQRPELLTTEGKKLRVREMSSLSDHAGTYTNLGYGNITLCPSEDTSTVGICTSVLRDFAAVENATGKSSGPCLLAHWPRIWSSHLRVVPDLRPRSETTREKFVVEPVTLFVDGYGVDKTPWEYTSGGVPLRVVRAEPHSGEEGRVIALEVCGIVGQPEDFRDACARFQSGQPLNEGWLVRFDKVEA